MSESTSIIICHLRELMAALDGRRPQPQRAGEALVVAQAADLRRRALDRLAELVGAGADPGQGAS